MVELLAEHFWRHQHYTTRTDMETFRIFLRIFPNYRAIGDMAPFVDDRLGDSAFSTNLDIGQSHDVLQHSIGVDPYI